MHLRVATALSSISPIFLRTSQIRGQSSSTPAICDHCSNMDMSLVGLGGRGKRHRLCRINVALLLARRGIRHGRCGQFAGPGHIYSVLGIETQRQAVAYLNGAATGASLPSSPARDEAVAAAPLHQVPLVVAKVDRLTRSVPFYCGCSTEVRAQAARPGRRSEGFHSSEAVQSGLLYVPRILSQKKWITAKL